ncbi:reverse transcriptase N-terminal domain-containing protein [Pseudomonas aeruginosa]|nr:reverse transcriptase N-terminal domain-containing protein [Pseudomonas aeruginosa]MDP5760985.1 reverse transcriptase N-terminal domain-containing protein [Pseudomonas aeruginosa]MDP5806045.1 reverse transcriptase N-terminal domain-containing protein [Pseudomonas aeruginosa]
MAVLAPNAQATASTGAPSNFISAWPQHWNQIESQVKRLQVRIAKATREGRWGKVQALQRLLTRSFSGKMLAVKRVTENRGKRTPGVDGKIWSTPVTFAFSTFLYPQHQQLALQLTCRSRQRYGLTLFRMDFRTGRAPRFRRRHHIHEGLSVRAPAWPRTFWYKPVSIFGLATMTTFI